MSTKRMAKLEVFTGIWNTTGEVLATGAGPAGTLIATDTYRWLPGKHFIVHDVDARFDGVPARSMEVMGFDAVRKKFFSTSYDDQGGHESFDIALSGRTWRIEGETVRFKGSFNAQWDRLAGLWEQKGPEGWQPWIKLLLVRA